MAIHIKTNIWTMIIAWSIIRTHLVPIQWLLKIQCFSSLAIFFSIIIIWTVEISLERGIRSWSWKYVVFRLYDLSKKNTIFLKMALFSVNLTLYLDSFHQEVIIYTKLGEIANINFEGGYHWQNKICYMIPS